MSPNLAIIITLLLAGLATAGCYFGWTASEITNKHAILVLLVSLFLWVGSACVFLRKWDESREKFVFLLGSLLSIFFAGWCATVFDAPNLAVIALRVNAVGSVIISLIVLYIISPGVKREHDSEET